MKSIFLSLIIIATTFHALAQDVQPDKIPTVVKNTFVTKYPKAVSPKWTHANRIYNAEFKIGLSDHQATIDSLGNLLKHQYEITFRSLPKAVNDNLNANYPEAKIENVEQVDVGRTASYIVHLRDVTGLHHISFNQEGKETAKK